MNEVRARVVIQEKGFYTLHYEGVEKIAEVSGKFRYEAQSAADFPTVGDYVVASWPEDESHSIITLLQRNQKFSKKQNKKAEKHKIVFRLFDLTT